MTYSGGWHILIVLAIVVLLFGATRLPALARSLGQSRNAFRAEMKKGEESASAQNSAASSAETGSASTAEETTNTTPKP
ncbi:MAG: twin-arginine translocase TatA/TatE family subunit [Galbitalea sp.]